MLNDQKERFIYIQAKFFEQRLRWDAKLSAETIDTGGAACPNPIWILAHFDETLTVASRGGEVKMRQLRDCWSENLIDIRSDASVASMQVSDVYPEEIPDDRSGEMLFAIAGDEQNVMAVHLKQPRKPLGQLSERK